MRRSSSTKLGLKKPVRAQYRRRPTESPVTRFTCSSLKAASTLPMSNIAPSFPRPQQGTPCRIFESTYHGQLRKFKAEMFLLCSEVGGGHRAGHNDERHASRDRGYFQRVLLLYAFGSCGVSLTRERSAKKVRQTCRGRTFELPYWHYMLAN